jgi:hypothetical protein
VYARWVAAADLVDAFAVAVADIMWSPVERAKKRERESEERLIFFGRRSKTARFQFKSAREELITLNQPVLGSSPRGLTKPSHLISGRAAYEAACPL